MLKISNSKTFREARELAQTFMTGANQMITHFSSIFRTLGTLWDNFQNKFKMAKDKKVSKLQSNRLKIKAWGAYP